MVDAMPTETFIAETKKHCEGYLFWLQSLIDQGRARPPDGKVGLFANILVITVTEEHFLVELVGAQRRFAGLNVKVQSHPHTTAYLNQLSTSFEAPAMLMGARGQRVIGARLALKGDDEEIEKRFPSARLYPAGFIFDGPFTCVLAFAPDLQYAVLQDCVLVNRYQNLIRTKHILALFAFKRSITSSEHKTYFEEIFALNNGHPTGVHACAPGHHEPLILVGQFQNLYMSPGLREPTIGEFLRAHPQILQAAFNSARFVYEPYLPWIEAPPENVDKAINPDLLIQNSQGLYDIYDLKTAALEKRTITKDTRKRRRFIDYVNEGIAQLANYREYFSFEKNAEFAKRKYGVVVKDPMLGLIVGNVDNADAVEIEEACRALKNVVVFDYDTLIQMFLSASLPPDARPVP